MATFSSHLLDATNGSHAANVEVIIYQINENGEKKVFCETKSDEGGRILQEFELSKEQEEYLKSFGEFPWGKPNKKGIQSKDYISIKACFKKCRDK